MRVLPFEPAYGDLLASYEVRAMRHTGTNQHLAPERHDLVAA